MFKFLMKLALDPAKDARHIAHCAKAAGSHAIANNAARAITAMYFKARIENSLKDSRDSRPAQAVAP